MKDYSKIKELNESAYDFIVNKVLGKEEELSAGKVQLEDGAYVSIQEYETKPRIETKYESHKKFIDVQMILKGTEIISVCPVELLEVTEPYNEEKDVAFYAHSPKGTDFVLTAGEFGVYTPKDGHQPCICAGKCSPVKKIVIKIPVKE
ncbi:MAG: YhcH/YjgK/YiaL family protein [Spirochaetia bacterium]|nr:YhcH/YjgK/YiaL family protein [Spirochaetia bacterium]